LQSELNLTIIIHGARHGSSTRYINGPTREAKLGMVEKIKEFCPKLQGMMLGETKSLQHGKVKVRLTRSTQVTMPRVSKHAREDLPRGNGWKNKCRLVKITLQRLFTGRAAHGFLG